MNKRFSTLVAAFAAIATVSYAQIGDKYVHLKTSSTYLTVTKENPVKADSVKLASLAQAKLQKTLLCGCRSLLKRWFLATPYSSL